MARVALVTGGTRGIGRAISEGLKKAGYKAVANYGGNDEVARKFTEETGIPAYKFDVGHFEETKAAIDKITQEVGPIDVLVNNAGITRDGTLHRMTFEQWNAVIQTNLASCFNMCRCVIESMRANKFGRIVNIGSRAWLGNRGQAAYSASKGAVVSLTRSLALEYARKGITVNAIAPGIVETPLFATLKDEVQQNLRKTVPMERIGQPQDIGRAVRFFAEPGSSYVTGQLLYVCGGRSLGSPSV